MRGSIDFNRTFRFTKQFDDIPQEDIARCPAVANGELPETLLKREDIPESIRDVLRQLPYPPDRKYVWVYVRPQWVDADKADTRIGAFYHCDMDAIYRCVASDWYDFKELLVTFGNVGETQFIADPITLDVDLTPKSSDYVTLSPHFNNREWNTVSPKPGQVTEYTMRDVHRAGPVRRTGHRLVIVCFGTDTEPVTEWGATQ